MRPKVQLQKYIKRDLYGNTKRKCEMKFKIKQGPYFVDVARKGED